jgi:DNA-binding transcriptional ArsR family regulator
MQIIEQTGFGVRSSVITLKRREGGPVFLLFPMLHVASPSFYARVQSMLAKCDVVVVEGVGGARTRVLTLSYTVAGRIRRSGLVLQSRGLNVQALPGKIVRPDLSAKEFGTAWRRVSRHLRWLLYGLTPIVGLWVAIVGPRRALGKDLGMDDLPSARAEQLSHDQLDQLLLGTRDEALIKALLDLADSLEPQPTATVGVCWGAGHIPAVVRALHARGFTPTSGEWVMAIPPE